MNTMFTIRWEHTFLDIILTQQEATDFISKIEYCLQNKQYLKFHANNKKRTVFIPYAKLKKGQIIFNQVQS